MLQRLKWIICGNNSHYGMLFHHCLSSKGICGKDYVGFEPLNWLWVRPWWPIEMFQNNIIQASLQSFMFKSCLDGWFEFGWWKMLLYHEEIHSSKDLDCNGCWQSHKSINTTNETMHIVDNCQSCMCNDRGL